MLLADVSSVSIPVFDMLSSFHTAATIETKLSLLQSHIRLCNNGQADIPAVIVTDFSYAMMYACLRAFNNETFVEYLQRCFLILRWKATKIQMESRTV